MSTPKNWLAMVGLALLATQSAAQMAFVHDSATDVLFMLDVPTLALTSAGSTVPGINNGPESPCGIASDGTVVFALDAEVGGGAYGGYWVIDPLTGTPANVGTTNIGGWSDVCWDPVTGLVLASNTAEIHSLDAMTGLNLVGQLPAGLDVRAMAVDLQGDLWVMHFGSTGEIGTIDRATFTYTQRAVTSLSEVHAIAFHPVTGVLHALRRSDSTLHRIDPTSGTTTLLGTLVGPGGTPLADARGFCFTPPGFGGPYASVAFVGAGCAGANGVPFLGPAPLSLPTLGNAAFGLQVQSAAPSAPLSWWLADSASVPGIPINGSCHLFLEPTSLLALVAQGLNPAWTSVSDPLGFDFATFSVPSQPMLAGSTVAVQVAIVDGSTPSGLTVTGAVELTLGY